MTLTNIFAPITKTERGDDGNLYVYGKMTGPDLDMDGQICDPTWLKSAVPKWFETGANVRLMHQPIAVGVGVELEQEGDDWWLSAKVVDPGAQKLVDEGVLTGFSIGIKGPKLAKDAGAPNGRIVGGAIIENSLVDRPCNETAKLVLAKMAGAELVEVEELTTKDADVMDTAGDLGTDDSDDIDYLQVAQAALAAWLASEAAEVAAGTGGIGVVAAIVTLLSDLSWAASLDVWDDEASLLESIKSAVLNGPTPEVAVNLSTIADLVKSVTTDDDKTALADLRKTIGVDDIASQLEEMTNTAQEAQTQAAAAQELVTKFAVRLAQVEEMAAPGGPHRLTPQEDSTAAAARRSTLSKIAEWRYTADRLTDRDLAAAYRQNAVDLEATLNV